MSPLVLQYRPIACVVRNGSLSPPGRSALTRRFGCYHTCCLPPPACIARTILSTTVLSRATKVALNGELAGSIGASVWPRRLHSGSVRVQLTHNRRSEVCSSRTLPVGNRLRSVEGEVDRKLTTLAEELGSSSPKLMFAVPVSSQPPNDSSATT